MIIISCSNSNLELACLSVVLLGVLTTYAQMEMKKVVGDNATLPCHHQFLVGDDPTLDIEWLLLKPTNRQRVVSVSPCKRLNVYSGWNTHNSNSADIHYSDYGTYSVDSIYAHFVL